ncbi:hypothetical protein [Sulfurimonas sp.]
MYIDVDTTKAILIVLSIFASGVALGYKFGISRVHFTTSGRCSEPQKNGKQFSAEFSQDYVGKKSVTLKCYFKEHKNICSLTNTKCKQI